MEKEDDLGADLRLLLSIGQVEKADIRLLDWRYSLIRTHLYCGIPQE